MEHDTTLAVPQPQPWHRVRQHQGTGLVFLILLLEAAFVACAFVVAEQLLHGHVRLLGEFDAGRSVMVAAVYFILRAVAVLGGLVGFRTNQMGLNGHTVALMGAAASALLLYSLLGTITWQQGLTGLLALGSVWAILVLFAKLVGDMLTLEHDRAAQLAGARSVALLGEPIACREMADLLAVRGSRVSIIGMFGACGSQLGRQHSGSDDFSSLMELVRARNVDEVVIALGGLDDSQVARWIEQLVIYPVNISIAPASLAGSLSGIHRLGAMLCVPLVRRPFGKRAAIGKRFMDVALATIGLIVLAPLLVLTMLAIKLDSRGPVFFRQIRTGYYQESFLMWKFRTMHHRSTGEGPFQQARPGDARITRVGRLLRRLSIDELPQLLNVLRGEMSLVGPRPHPLTLNEQFARRLPLYAARHRVLPGITGLAQVHGFRGETDTLEKMAKRLEYDLTYIGSWSIWLDLKIVLLTLTGRFTHPNAY